MVEHSETSKVCVLAVKKAASKVARLVFELVAHWDATMVDEKAVLSAGLSVACLVAMWAA